MHARFLACALLLAPGVALAQADADDGWRAFVLDRADSLYFAGEPEAAFGLLRAHVEERPDDYQALWRIVRATVVLGVAAEGWRMQNSWLDTGMGFGDLAVELRPDGVEGRYWRGAVTGRRALNAAPEYGAELAQRAYEDAHAVLVAEPGHGGAHNILGRIFFEIMSMSRVQRWIGRTFVRTDALRESSWEAAELHLDKAAAEWPDWIPFQYDLAALYEKRGRDDEARAAYRRVTHMPAVHPTDPALQEDAERQLEELGSP
jgi:tetratricopeptide (TPR) repeat protein